MELRPGGAHGGGGSDCTSSSRIGAWEQLYRDRIPREKKVGKKAMRNTKFGGITFIHLN